MGAKHRYEYITSARPAWPGQGGNESHDAHRVDFQIHAVVEAFEGGQVHEELEDEPVLTGMVDWQGGINLWQAEGIEPSEFVAIMATAHAAIWEARTLIGANWIHGENGAEYDPADAPTA